MNPLVPTVPYLRILRGAVTRAGEVWPCDRELVGVFMGGIATAIREAWTAYDWPLLVEPKRKTYYDGAWAGETYAINTIVWHDGQPWLARLPIEDAEEIPGISELWVNGDDWGLSASSAAFVYLPDPTLVLEVFEDDPMVVVMPRRMRWMQQNLQVRTEAGALRLEQTGVRVWPVAGRTGLPEAVWVAEKAPIPMLEGGEWDETLAYVAGEGMWWNEGGVADGNFYLCLEATTAGESPETDEAKWQVQAVPAFLETYLIYSAVAGYLEGEKGTGPQSQRVRKIAEAALEDEMRKAQERDRRMLP
jgi:hypothetical protein